jgi:type VI protein secretion system component VasK
VSVWGWSVGLGLFGSFALIKITTLELRGPEWARLVAEAIMWLGWAALVWWSAVAADRRQKRRTQAFLQQIEADRAARDRVSSSVD